MTRRNQNFGMHIGETKTVFIALTNEDGSAFDPVGCTFKWWLAKTSQSDALVQKLLGAGLVLGAGGINVLLASEDTYDLRPAIYYHELKIGIVGSSGLSVSTVGAVHLRHALDMREGAEPLKAGRR